MVGRTLLTRDRTRTVDHTRGERDTRPTQDIVGRVELVGVLGRIDIHEGHEPVEGQSSVIEQSLVAIGADAPCVRPDGVGIVIRCRCGRLLVSQGDREGLGEGDPVLGVVFRQRAR